MLLWTAIATADDTPKAPPPKPPTEGSAATVDVGKRTELNLQGQTDTSTGESRRNENVQFNPIDNNALKELNVRMGITATIVTEFQADRNYFGAEYGKPVPAVLHLPVSKISGVHGDFYEWHNNSIFSARSFFQVGSVQPARTNDYGFHLGTPLWRGATFTLDGNQQKNRGSVNGNVLVPLPSERKPLTSDPAARAIILRFLSAYPQELPNRTDIDPRALNTNSPQSIDTDSTGGRLDQQLGIGRLSLQYRFTNQKVNAFELIAGQNPDTDNKAHSTRLTWNRAWSTRTVTDFSLGFDRLRSLLVPEPNSVGPQVTFGGVIDPLGPSSNLPIDRAQNQFHYAGQVHHQSGGHLLHSGFEVIRHQINGSEYSSQRGVIYFTNDFGRDAMTNFLEGIPSRFSTGIGDPHRGFRYWDMQFYAGDNWKVNSRLSLSYGLRYQPVTRPWEVNGLSTVPYGCTCRNFAPRLGLAWRLPGRWGILRSAYGLHYGEIFPVTFQQVRFNPPGVIKIEVQAPNLVNPLGALTPADFAPDARSTIFRLSPNLATPYSHQYNFTWEPGFSTNWKLQLGYVGSRSDRLLMMWFDNRAIPVPGIPQTTASINLRRPDPTHFEIRRVENASRGYFDAARISVVVPRWHGVTLDTSYWFSKALDTGGSYTNQANSADSGQIRSQSQWLVQNDLKGPSAFDQTHAFLARAGWQTPGVRWLGSWNFSTVVLWKTGTPFDVLSGSDSPGYGNVDGSTGDRPNLLDASILGRTIDNPDTSTRLLPRAAFGFIQPTDLRGNLGHNVFRKGGIHNVNAALARTWSLRSDRSLTFRAESINFFNSPQFAEPTKELTSPSFGQITNTLNDGRTFRFLLRFSF